MGVSQFNAAHGTKKRRKSNGEKTKTDMLGRSGRSVAAAPVEYFLDSRLTERLVDRYDTIRYEMLF